MIDHISTDITDQAEWIYQFGQKTREEFNPALFQRSNEKMVAMVSSVIKSCERDRYFTLIVQSIRPIYDYNEILETLRLHEENRHSKKNAKFDNQYNYIQLNDSDIILLEVKYYIRKNGMERMLVKDPITGKEESKDVMYPDTTLTDYIALPRYVDHYYYHLAGNNYMTVNQIVDGSTYNNSTTNNSKHDYVTEKTLFGPIKIFRMEKELVSVVQKGTNLEEEKVNAILYTCLSFGVHCDAMYYILAKYGLYSTLQFFNVPFISILDYPIYGDKRYYCFNKYDCYIVIPKIIFNENPVAQSLVATIYDGIRKETKASDVFKWDYWLSILGAAFKNSNPDKGLFVLSSLESLYDNVTKEEMHLPDYLKQDVYMLLRWMIVEFGPLRAKDNVDVSTKRFRNEEIIAHVVAKKLSSGIHRVSDLGKKVKLKQIVSAVYISPMYVINNIIGMSNLISYDDLVNDNDGAQALKFSYKGISGLGEDGVAIQDVYRYVDTSHLGILDLDTSSASDPGMSGIICPMTKTYGTFFSDFEEPHEYDGENNTNIEKYYKRIKANVPVKFEQGAPFDRNILVDTMTSRSEELDNKVCPVKDLDGKIDYRLGRKEQL